MACHLTNVELTGPLITYFISLNILFLVPVWMKLSNGMPLEHLLYVAYIGEDFNVINYRNVLLSPFKMFQAKSDKQVISL